MDSKQITETPQRKKLVQKKSKPVSKIPRADSLPDTSKKISRIPLKNLDKQLGCHTSRKENVSVKKAQKRKNTFSENEEESVEAIQKYLAKENIVEQEKEQLKRKSEVNSFNNEVKKDDTVKVSTEALSFAVLDTNVTGEAQLTKWDNLNPDFIDLILKPKSNKVRRPPNAFMLFAKEQRCLIQTKNSEADNRKISSILGETWRNLDSNEKIKYYSQAMALEKLHKQIYPNYVYNPAAARLNKEKRKAKKLSIDSLPVLINEQELSSSNYSTIKDHPKNKQDETPSLTEVLSGKENEETTNIKSFSPPKVNQFVSPEWNSPMCKEWSACRDRAPLNETYCNLYCSPPMYNSMGNYPNFKRYPPFDPKERELGHSFGSSSSTPFNAQNMYPSNFFPTTYSPWLVWPPPLPRRPRPSACLKNWMPSTSSDDSCPDNPRPSFRSRCLQIDDAVLTAKSLDEEFLRKDISHYSDDDDSNSLIIVDDINSDDDLYTPGCHDSKLGVK